MFCGLLLILAIMATTYRHALSVLSVKGRIVGGENAKIEDFPYQVSIRYNGAHDCGGSILKPRVIISAAHCLRPADLKAHEVRYGSTNVNSGKIVEIQRIDNHEKFSSDTFDYDIGIAHLADDIVFGPNAQPIALARNTPAPGTEVVVSGWGRQYYQGPATNILQKVEVEIKDHTICTKEYINNSYHITDRMLCAGVNGGVKDSCSGDSGGPLVANNELVGIVSWGKGCALPDYAGVYTNVVYLRSWIESKLKG